MFAYFLCYIVKQQMAQTHFVFNAIQFRLHVVFIRDSRMQMQIMFKSDTE